MSSTLMSSQDITIIRRVIQDITDSTADQQYIYEAFTTRTGSTQDPWFERHFAALATDSERHQLDAVRIEILNAIFRVQTRLVAFSRSQPAQARMLLRLLELDYGQQKIHLEREHRGYVIMRTNKTAIHQLWQKRARALQEYIYFQRLVLANLCLHT